MEEYLLFLPGDPRTGRRECIVVLILINQRDDLKEKARRMIASTTHIPIARQSGLTSTGQSRTRFSRAGHRSRIEDAIPAFSAETMIAIRVQYPIAGPTEASDDQRRSCEAW